MVQEAQIMKTFKTYLNEGIGSSLAALAIAGSALAAPPKPEALQRATDYIKSKESFIDKARPDEIATGKPLMIGYGTTKVYPDGKPIKASDRLTEPEAAQHLSKHISKMTPHMEKIPGWDEMDAGKQAALMSFAYNTGSGFYGTKGYETISGHLQRKEWDKVPEAMKLYNKSAGKVRGGLVTRRAEEGQMWSGGEAPKQQVKPAAQSSDTHEVVRGDTLGAIAKKYGKTVQDIQKINPEIKDPNKIAPGQKIKTK
jgi:GH24 family phage-related lysozyme (muramidase)